MYKIYKLRRLFNFEIILLYIDQFTLWRSYIQSCAIICYHRRRFFFDRERWWYCRDITKRRVIEHAECSVFMQICAIFVVQTSTNNEKNMLEIRNLYNYSRFCIFSSKLLLIKLSTLADVAALNNFMSLWVVVLTTEGHVNLWASLSESSLTRTDEQRVKVLFESEVRTMSSPFLMWWYAISDRIAIHISTIGPSSLPRAMHSMAICHDNTTNLIWLIGGWSPNQKSLVSFNVSRWNDTNAYVDHEYPLSASVSSASQAYVQTGPVIYVVEYTGNKLLRYDILTKDVNSIDTNTSSVEILFDACLTSIADWIIYTYIDWIYILTISNQSWKLSGNQIMPNRRHKHACIIEPDRGYLYSNSDSDCISKLYVKNITNIQQ